MTGRQRLPVLGALALALSMLAAVAVACNGDEAASGTTDAVATVDVRLVVDRMSSPAANVARAEGRLLDTADLAADVAVDVSADGVRLGPVALEPDATGRFVVDITGLAPGPQTVCLGEVCTRVLVAAPGTEPIAVIRARIEAAVARAGSLFDHAAHLRGWSVEIAGPNSSVGGYTVESTRTIFVSANSGRSDDELLVTVLHELGHAVDLTYMTAATRGSYRALRGLADDLPWGATDHVEVGADRWRNAAEDFAEVFVAWVLDGAYATQTAGFAPPPTPEDLNVFCELLAIDGLTCD